jgi:hypothetical protein
LWAVALGQVTIAGTTLKTGESYKGTSNRDDTLLVAWQPVVLEHQVNVGKPWEWVPSKPVNMELPLGGVEWLPEGKHHLRNTSEKEAHFITIEF